MIRHLRSEMETGPVIQNIARMLQENSLKFSCKDFLFEQRNNRYEGLSWDHFFASVRTIAANLARAGFVKGDRMILFSHNCSEMLQLEMAVMASGGISVPIFANFDKATAELLMRHCGASFAAAASRHQLDRISPELPLKKIFCFENETAGLRENVIPFSELLEPCTIKNEPLLYDAAAADICLNMYTSGTMGIPKCVQLSHRNILSQQAGIRQVWNLDSSDRFLSYLPWHHSFGGIFEKFSALCSGSSIYLEPGRGKDMAKIFESWKLVMPTVFFSVPKIYQQLVEMAKAEPKAEELLYHSGLRFIFTAAASLPAAVSDEFTKRGIPVLEGWGLTETSPCCTLTGPHAKREPGLVGMPLPGVTIRIADDQEIQVSGPNVMAGYYRNDEANKSAFTDDGWFRTGDIGEIVPEGLRLIARKDRIFKLTNGEKVIPSEAEQLIQGKCNYISFALVSGAGKEFPVALLFPNKRALEHPSYEHIPFEGCFCPRTVAELSKCLQGCLNDVNCGFQQKFSRIRYAMMIDDELTVEKSTLTPSMKLAPNKVMDVYKAHIQNLYGSGNSLEQEVYIIRLDGSELNPGQVQDATICTK